jgi:hypothetical protein
MCFIFLYTRAIWKVTSEEMLIKQAMRKKYYIKKSVHTKLLLNIVTAGTEVLVLAE